MFVFSRTKLFSYEDGCPDPRDIVPMDGPVFDHYTTLYNAINIMEKGYDTKNGRISCFHRANDPLIGSDMAGLVKKYGKFSEDGVPGQKLEKPWPEDKPLKIWPADHEAVIWHKPGVFWHDQDQYWRKKTKGRLPLSYIALTDCDNLFIGVPLSHERIGWVFKGDVVRAIFRQNNPSKADKSVRYRDHLDFGEKRFVADKSIEWLAIEIPYYKKPMFDEKLLAKLRQNPQWLSPTKETVQVVFGTEPLKKHKYPSEKELCS